MLDVERVGLVGPTRVCCPIEDLVDIGRTTDPILPAVVDHSLLRDPLRGRRLMPEVDPIDRVIDFPFDVAGIHSLSDHPPSLGTDGMMRRLNEPWRESSGVHCRSVAPVALETDEPVKAVAVDYLPVGGAPGSYLQVVHDLAALGEVVEPTAQRRRAGST